MYDINIVPNELLFCISYDYVNIIQSTYIYDSSTLF